MKKIAAYLILGAVVLAACSPQQVDVPQTVVVRETSIVQVTALATVIVTQIEIQTAEVTRIVERPVTVTPTETPFYTPTKVPTPTRTPNRTAQAAALAQMRSTKADGFYLVYIDIAPGVWRSTGTGDSCYWKRSTSRGKIIETYYGNAGGTIYIAASDYQVQFSNCGPIEFLSE